MRAPSLGALGRRLWFGGVARLLSAALALAAPIGPLRRRIHDRTKTAAGAAQSVLFVCHGNLNRSAYAAALARRDLPAMKVFEAGHDAVERAPTGELGVATAKLAGVELDRHRATGLNAQILVDVDVVFVFDARNYLALASRGAAVQRKLRLLAALAPTGPLEVEDPHGGPQRLYLEAFAAIAGAMAAWPEAAARPAPPSDTRGRPGSL